MASSPKIKTEAAIPFWRDVRVLGVIAQIVFMTAVVIGVGWFIRNFLINAEAQGLKTGFGFLNITAAFDIKEGITYENTDHFGRALWVGIANTIRVAFIGCVFTTFLGTIIGISRLSNNWLISRIATVYVEIIRNTPLLVQLFFIYFGFFIPLPSVKEAIQPFGWPIFLSQRGVALPSLTATAGFPIWLAFIILAIIFSMVIWIIQTWQEDKTGQTINKLGSAVIAFVLITLIGWFVTAGSVSNQAIMVAGSRNIEATVDFEKIYLLQVDEDALRDLGVDRDTAGELTNSAEAVARYQETLNLDIEAAIEAGEDTENLTAQLALLNQAKITVCGLENDAPQINAASQLRRRSIAVKVNTEKDMTKAGAAYSDGKCDLLAGNQAELAAVRAVLDDPKAHEIVSITAPPLVVNTPALAGFNIEGGTKLSPEFAALLLGLTLYTSAFAAEIVRAGILAVSKGQSEAARALGLNEGQRLRLIVLPQAMRVIIPPMTSQYLNLTKNSSLAVAIGYPDLVSVGNTVMNQSGFAIQVIMVFMASYLTLSLSISAFLNWYNKKVALVER
jgi:His/Glu/Gln/Arg/opine family amino acid ABC transporter permease subunit